MVHEDLIVETSRLLLRPLRLEDAPILHPIWEDPAVAEFFMQDPFATLEESTQMTALLAGLPENDEGRRWAIQDRLSGELLGTCGFHNVKREHRRAEIGYEIKKACWGKGVMTEALTALLAYCFEKEDFNRLEAFVTLGNERSYRVLRRAGFRQDGILRDYEFGRGRFFDHVVFSLLQREWRKHSVPAPNP